MKSSVTIRAPKSDIRSYRSIMLNNGVKILLVQDSECTFGAAAINVHAGYLDDQGIHGLAHMLEHAVHLGSYKYPGSKEYKSYLSSHGGSSNASTSIAHTQFHFTVLDSHLDGAIDRLSRFFIDPMLQKDDVMSEVENVHAEFSRNCNSDDRKLLQLKRSTMGPPYNSFSTGNLKTLRDEPLERNLSLEDLVRRYWDKRYRGDSIRGCIVSSHSLDDLEGWVTSSFSNIRPNAAKEIDETKEEEEEEEEEGWRRWMRDASDPSKFARALSPQGSLGLLFNIRPKRDLRSIEIRWFIPYGSMLDSSSKPWRFVGHLLGHESKGSLAYELKRKKGLIQSLSVGIGDEVRPRVEDVERFGVSSSGFIFYSLTMSLTEKGEASILTEGDSGLKKMLSSVYEELKLIRGLNVEERARIHAEVKSLTESRFEYADRSQPLDLAKDASNRLHYFKEEEVLSGPALLGNFDADALDRFLSHLQPRTMNVYVNSRHHPPASTPLVEEYYKAEYGVRPLGDELLKDIEAGHDKDPELDLHLPLRNWALPLDFTLISPPSDAAVLKNQERDSTHSRHSFWSPPQLLENATDGVKVWHRTDVSLSVPKAHVYLHIVTPLSYLSSQDNYIACCLYCKLVDDLLEPLVYDGELAGTTYSLSSSDTGLVLHFSGFSSVVKALVEHVIRGMRDLSPDQVNERYEVVKGRLVQQWRVWQKNNPLTHCEHFHDHILSEPSHLVSDSLKILEGGSIGPDRVIDWCMKLFEDPIQIHMLTYGNLDEGEARALASRVKLCFDPKGAMEPPPRPSILKLPRSVGDKPLIFRPVNPNPSNSNSAIVFSSEIGVGENHPAISAADVETSVLASLLVKIASKPCFHSLRTVQRLGYTVQLTLNKMDRVLYLQVKVQSPDKSTDELRESVQEWLKDYRSELIDLSSIQFESFKQSLCEHYLEPPRSLSEAASRAWAPIRTGTFDWDARRLKAVCVKAVIHQQLVAFYDKHVLPSATQSVARLCVEVQSGNGKGGEREAKKPKINYRDVIVSQEEVAAFKSSQPRF